MDIRILFAPYIDLKKERKDVKMILKKWSKAAISIGRKGVTIMKVKELLRKMILEKETDK